MHLSPKIVLSDEKRVIECCCYTYEKALVQANEAKGEGNKLFVDGKYEEALSQYELALQVAPDMPSSVEIRSICRANRAVCFQKLVWCSFILLMRIAFVSTFPYYAHVNHMSYLTQFLFFVLF